MRHQKLLISRIQLFLTCIVISFYSCEKDSNPNEGVQNVNLTLFHGYRYYNAYFDSILPNAKVGLILTNDVPLARTVGVYDNYYSFKELSGLVRYNSQSDEQGIATFIGVRAGQYHPLIYFDDKHYHLVCYDIYTPGSNFYLDVKNDSIIRQDVIASALQLNDYYSGINATIFWREGDKWNPGDTSFVEGINVALTTFRPETVEEAKANAVRIAETNASGLVTFDSLGSPYKTYYLIVYYNETEFDIPSDAFYGIYPGFNKDENYLLEVDEFELGIAQ